MSTLDAIRWFDGERLRKSAVLVVGAGALGSVLIEHLVRNGIGTVVIADRDERIEEDNLSRSFTRGDMGTVKVQAAAARCREIDPSVKILPVKADIEDLGIGLFSRIDLVMGCVDNRRARAVLNARACFHRKVLIDAAIDGESLSGTVRVIQPSSSPFPCLICSWTDRDFMLMEREYACRDEMPPLLPTTSTIAGVTGAMQASEAIMCLLRQARKSAGHEIRVQLDGHEMMLFQLPVNPECRCDHQYMLEPNRLLRVGPVEKVPGAEILEKAIRFMESPDVELSLPRSIVKTARCGRCGEVMHPRRVPKVREVLLCECGGRAFPIDAGHTLTAEDLSALKTRPLSDMGIPEGDILGMKSTSNGKEAFLIFDFDLQHLADATRPGGRAA